MYDVCYSYLWLCVADAESNVLHTRFSCKHVVNTGEKKTNKQKIWPSCVRHSGLLGNGLDGVARDQIAAMIDRWNAGVYDMSSFVARVHRAATATIHKAAWFLAALVNEYRFMSAACLWVCAVYHGVFIRHYVPGHRIFNQYMNVITRAL